MTLLPPLSAHADDAPLHEDVRLLASTLGRVIRRMEGEECFQAVERLRSACRSRRLDKGGSAGPEEILAYVDSLPLELAAKVARAFALFFLLINTAEQVHRVKRGSEEGHRPQEGTPSLKRVLEQLKEGGLNADNAMAALSRLDVCPVLTAHPTEATRRTILALQARIADRLLARNAAGARQSFSEEALEAEVELLWLTAEVRAGRPSVMDEVRNVLWYLENRLMAACEKAEESLCRAFEDVYGRELRISYPLRMGSWVGGDRDGNPYVTPEITLKAVRLAARTTLTAHLRSVKRLGGQLSLSSRIKGIPEDLAFSLGKDRDELSHFPEGPDERDGKEREGEEDEPVRLKLRFMARRLEANIAELEGGKPRSDFAYPDAEAFEKDLLLVRRALVSVGAERVHRLLVDPLLARLRTFGFHGFSLDIREDARVYAAAVEDIVRSLGMAPFGAEDIRRELLGRRPLLNDRLQLEDRTKNVIEMLRSVNRAQKKIGRKAVSTCIVSMTSSSEDLLRVLLLCREAGLLDLAAEAPISNIDIVPLFETGLDLERAPDVMRTLFADPSYRRHLQARGMRQEIMIGYSDSAKDVGILPASWAVYRAQEKLSDLCRDEGVKHTFFHGRGGTVGRGGGSPVFRALQALPPGTVEGRIKITEQGEVISQKFGMLPLADLTLEVMLSGAILVSFGVRCAAEEPGEQSRFHDVMDRLAGIASPIYRRYAHEEDRLFRLFLEATPVRELARVHFGSRPVYREKGTETLEALRAIPWVFGWTQIRLNVSSWLGVGTALSRIAGEKEGLALLRRMAASWCFFDDLLAKIEMICAKTDPQIASLYVARLSPRGADLFLELEQEFHRTVEAIKAIRQAPYLLSGQTQLQTAIGHRDPYMDPLSLLQVSLLSRKREIPEGTAEREVLDRALGTTLNGLAQGLRNTG